MITNGGVETDLTINELAEQVGMTVRNVRAYQSRGLLQPPEVRGRVGYYGSEHVARIELVRRFQSQGFNLQAIGALLDRGDSFLQEVEQLRRDLQDDPLEDWTPMTEEEIRLCEASSPGSIERFTRIGSIRRRPDGVLLGHRTLSEQGWELNRMGVAPQTIIDLMFVTARSLDTIGDVYMEVFHERAVAALGSNPGQQEIQDLRDVFEEMTPHAVQVMTTMFEIVLRKQSATSFERAVRQLAPTSDPA